MKTARPLQGLRRAAAAAGLLALTIGGALAQDYQRDVLRVGINNTPDVLDPQRAVSLTGSRVLYNLFDTLIQMNPEDNSILEPYLATSWERVGDTVLRLELRDDVTFHDGSAFTAADVKFSLERVLDPAAPYGLARGLLEVIDHVEIIDDYTVDIHTIGPDPVLEQRLASLWGSWIVPAGYIEENGTDWFERNPVGTGPFSLVSYEADRIVLEAYPDYWGEQPNVRQVVYQVIPEASSRFTALVNGEVDLINPVLPDQVNTLRGYDNVEVICRPHQLVHLLVYSTAHPQMSDQLLRQAINLAIPRGDIVDALWTEGASETRGHQLPEYGELYLEDHPYPAFDLERARQLVEQSSYAGEVLYYDLVPGYYDNDLEAAEIIVETLREIGVNAQIRQNTAFWREGFAIHPWSYAMRMADPVGGLWLLFGGDENGQRQPRWVNADQSFNVIGQQLATTFDTAERRELFRDLLLNWEDQAPGTTLYQPSICWGVAQDVEWLSQPSHTMDFGAASLRFRD